MKRMIAYLGLAAALSATSIGIFSPSLASTDLGPVDDPVAMFDTSSLVTGLIAADAVDNTFLGLDVAYDSSFHPSCRGEAKAAHANFCAQIEAGPLVTGDHVSAADQCDVHPVGDPLRPEYCDS